jgi:replicative superfamily II helicase
MSNYLENNWLTKDHIDKIVRIKKISETKKILDAFNEEISIQQNELAEISEVLTILELSVLAQLKIKKNNNTKTTIQSLAYDYFSISSQFEIIKNIEYNFEYNLKILCFSYLAEKSEDGKKYFRSKREYWDQNSTLENSWLEEIAHQIERVFILLIVKEDWSDLEKINSIIKDLKDKQKENELNFFNEIEEDNKRGSAYLLISFYNLLTIAEKVSIFNMSGSPSTSELISDIELYFEIAIRNAGLSGNLSIELSIRLLETTLYRMVYNSIWRLSEFFGGNIEGYIQNMTRLNNPIFELLYPQRKSLLEEGLLDPVNRSIVVNLPTSSGKTLIAEFKILQTLSQFPGKTWVAYVVPTKALVNQITARLRKNLGQNSVELKIEKMSGALEIDTFEESKIKQKSFDVLVVTPEKLNLLIKQGIDDKLEKFLGLVIIDEAHNIEDPNRGIVLELLLSTIQNDCPKTNYLLMTPFIPNADEVASWLNPTNSKSISIGLEWVPNERVVGIFYPTGKARDWKIVYQPLITSHHSLVTEKKIEIMENSNYEFPISSMSKKRISSIAAVHSTERDAVLVVLRTKENCWDAANEIYNENLDLDNPHKDIVILQKYIEVELGSNFPLINFLRRGIGVHHAGLPEEIRLLQEILMEKGLLKYLIATTTVAQGINFPVSDIIIGSYHYPFKEMPSRDFWNLVGRAGRVQHNSIGIIGIATTSKKEDKEKTAKYLLTQTEDLKSTLVGMVRDAMELRDKLNLKSLSYIPEWSSFLQYISHMYRQSENLEKFISETRNIMKKTYGYSYLDEEEKQVLVEAVKAYGKELDKNKSLATLSDATGLSPEAVNSALGKMHSLGFEQEYWQSNNLFSENQYSNNLKDLVGIMLKIPEIKKSLKDIFNDDYHNEDRISQLIKIWVSGKSIKEIAVQIYGNDDVSTLTKLVTTLYSKISNFATWGLSSLQKLPTSGIDFENLTDIEKRAIQNIPAMVCYGVNSDEAILLRSNGLPRSIAIKMGEILRSSEQDIYTMSSNDVLNWLNILDEDIWNTIAYGEDDISGSDYKKIWKHIAGVS